MQSSDISRLTQVVVAQVTGGLVADLIVLKAENALLKAENERLKSELEPSENKPSISSDD